MATRPDYGKITKLSGWDKAPYDQFLRRHGTAVIDAQAIREVIGIDAFRRVLNHAYLEQRESTSPSPYFILGYDEYAYIHKIIRDLYGLASHGILNRIGRITFRHFIEEQPNQMSAINIALRLMPLRARKIFILRVIARSMSENNHKDTVYLNEDEGRLTLVDTDSPACAGISAKKPICWHTVGFLEEALQWSTGQDFKVEETSCRAQGDPVCIFTIAREPNAPLQLA